MLWHCSSWRCLAQVAGGSDQKVCRGCCSTNVLVHVPSVRHACSGSIWRMDSRSRSSHLARETASSGLFLKGVSNPYEESYAQEPPQNGGVFGTEGLFPGTQHTSTVSGDSVLRKAEEVHGLVDVCSIAGGKWRCSLESCGRSCRCFHLRWIFLSSFTLGIHTCQLSSLQCVMGSLMFFECDGRAGRMPSWVA